MLAVATEMGVEDGGTLGKVQDHDGPSSPSSLPSRGSGSGPFDFA